jgi:CshA-type fibril repeat protein
VNIGLELDNASKASSDGCGAYAVNGKCPAGTQSALTKNPPDGSGNGNDGAIDNIRVLDVSPYLTKSFNPTTVKVGDTSTLTLTVNNRTDNGTKNGWAFTDALPDGLVVANTPNVKADGNNGSCKADVTAGAGDSSIDIKNGDLPGGSSAADPTTCTITVDVTPTKAGDLTNGSSNIESTVGMDGPQTPATLTAIEGPTAQDSSATTQPGVAVDLKPTTGFGTSQKFTSVAFDKSGATTKTVPGEGTWTITLGDDGQPVATFTPDADFTGKATTQPYIVTDENNLTATANLDVTVAAITGPTAQDKSATTKPSTPVTLNPETGFGTSQTFTSVAFDDKGTTTKDVPGEGTWTIKLNDEGKPEAVFTPVDGFTGTATPQPYIVTDENGKTATANLDVTVLAPPTAKDKSATTNPKTPVTLDPETGFGTSQTFTGVAFDKSGATTKDVPGEGSWTISLNDKGQPEAVFTPVDGFTGKTTPVPYIVTDENGLTATANLDVTVLAPPTASDKSATTDPGKAVTLDPETGFGTSQKFTGVAFDDKGATTKDVPGEGSWTISLNDKGQPEAVFTPVDGFTGKTTPVPYIVTDENGLTATANLDVTVNKPLTPPTTNDKSAAINPNQTATLNPVTTPGSGDITDVKFVAPADGKGSLSADGKTLTVPGEGTWTIKLDDKGQPVATFAPDKDYSGPVTEQQYTVTDANNKTATGKLDVTINEPPTAKDKSATTNPKTPVTLNPDTTFGTSQKFTSVAFDDKGATTKDVPGEGTWTIKLNDKGQPEAVFTPVDGFTGKTTAVPYIVTDGNGLTATANLDVTVLAPPTTGDASKAINPNETATLTPKTVPGSGDITDVKFTDPAATDGGKTLVVPNEGTWTIKLDNGQPVATFAPDKDYSGPVTEQPYTVTDSNKLTATGKLDVTINTPPTAKDESATTDPGKAVTLDPETGFGTSKKFTGVAFDDKGTTTKTVPGEGTWTIKLGDNGQPTAVFTPVDGFTGKTTPVPYTVTDGNGLTATANLDVTVLAPPTTGDASKTINPNQTATLNPVTKPGSGDITDVTFTDPAATDGGKTLVVPNEGTWSIKLDNGQPVATFAPDKDYSGPVTEQQYTVTDSNKLTATGKLDVTINTPPTAKDKSATTNPKTPVTLDPETGFGTSKKFTGVAFDDKGATTKDVPGEGSWTISLNDKGQPEAVFTPVDGFTGKTTPVPYIVTDENGLTATANLDVTVLAPPTASDKSATTDPKTPVTLDPETGFGTSQTFTGVAFDDKGATTKDVPGEGSWTISLNDKGQPEAVFTPVDGFTGKTTPQPYIVTDENGLTATANLDVTVNKPLTPPTTGDKSATTNPDTPVTLNPVTTPGSAPIKSVVFDNNQPTKDVPGQGTWTIELKDGQPVATFTPDKGFTGKVTDQKYTVTDENDKTADGTLSVTINTPPTAKDKSATTNPSTPVTLNPKTGFGTSKTFTGVAFDDKGATTKTVPNEGTWTIKLGDNGQPTAVFTPADGFTGKTTPVPYTVTDGNGLTATANLDVTVLAPPTASDKSATTDPKTPVTLDPDTTFGTSQKFTKVPFDNGDTTKTVDGEGVWTIKLDDNGQPTAVFTPADGFTGKTTPVPYTVTDENGLTATANLDVTVNKPLTPPTTGDASKTIDPNTTATLTPKTVPGSGDITSVKFDDPAATDGGKTLVVSNEGTWSIKLDNGQPVATFTPLKDYSGKVTPQKYTVTDSNGKTADGTLNVTINPPAPVPPKTGDKSATTNPGKPVTLNPVTTPGSSPITSVVFDNGQPTKDVPGEGTWTIKLGDNGQPTAVFTPVDGFTGKTTPVPYTVTDENGKTATGKLDVTVNTPPTTGDKSATTNPKTPVTLAPKTTPGSSPITSVVFDNGQPTKDVPNEGTWTVKLDNGQPVAVFTPADGFTGKTTPQPYTVTDENGLTATAKLDVTVLAPPTTGDAAKTIDPNTTATLNPAARPGSGDITAVAFDNGKDTKTVPGEGSWSIKLDNGQPIATFTPDKDYSGKVTPQSYTVTDANKLTADGTLNVTINPPAPVPPKAGDKTVTAEPGAPVTLNPVTTPGSSPIKSAVFDNGKDTKVVPGQGTWTIKVVDGQPVATFTPEPGFKGSPDPQQYTVTDGNGQTAEGTLTINVPAAPVTPPTTGDKTVTTDPGKPVTLAPTAKPGSAPIKSAVFDNGKDTKTVPGEGVWTIKVVDGQPVATFTPDKGFTGKTTPQQYTVTDGNGKTATGTLDVTITTPPSAKDQSATTDPKTPVTLNPETGFGTSQKFTAVTFDNGKTAKDVPGEGSWSIKLGDNGQPVAVFTPADGFTGKTTPQPYTVTDENGLTATGKLDVTVNTPPTTGDNSGTTDPGKPVTLAPVTKPGSAPIKSVVFDNGQPTKVVPGEGTWTIQLKDGQPVPVFAPADGFTGKTTPQPYTVTDENGLTATGKLDVTVNAPAPVTPPTTGDKSETGEPGKPVTLNPVTKPGSAPIKSVTFDNGQPKKVVPGQGTWTVELKDGQPVVTFTPEPGFKGSPDPQQYTVTDENGKTAEGTLTINVPAAPVTPPTTGDKSATTDPGKPVTLAPTAKPGSAPITSVVFDNGQPTKDVPGEGTWTIELKDGQPVATFTPIDGFTGKTTPQQYTVKDENGKTADGTLTVTISAPPATGDQSTTAKPGAPVTLKPVTKPGSAPITSVVFDNGQPKKDVPGQGTWTVELKDGQPVVTFTPEPGFKGSPDSQKYTVKDKNGKTADGTLTIDVPALTPPTTGDKSAATDPGAPVTLAPTAKPGTAPIKSAVFDNGKTSKTVPGEGTWTIKVVDGQPVAVFAPVKGFTGKTTPQQYTVTDENGLTADGSLDVTVNTPPVTGDKTVTAEPGAPVTLAPTAKPGTAPIVSAVFDNGKDTKVVPGQGTWTIELKDGQPVVTFTPEPGFKGSPDSQKYTVTDGNGKTAEGTLTINVPAAPVPPKTGDKTVTAKPGKPVTLTPTAKPGSAPIKSAVFDNGKDTKTVPGEGTWTIKVVDGQPVATFTPAKGFSGKATPQKYTVTDENGKTATGTLGVDVPAAPAAPGKTPAPKAPAKPVPAKPAKQPQSILASTGASVGIALIAMLALAAAGLGLRKLSRRNDSD